jgi:hypothetical protein
MLSESRCPGNDSFCEFCKPCEVIGLTRNLSLPAFGGRMGLIIPPAIMIEPKV